MSQWRQKTPREKCLLYNMTCAHLNAQRLWQYAQGLHTSNPDGVSALRWFMDIRLISNLEGISN